MTQRYGELVYEGHSRPPYWYLRQMGSVNGKPNAPMEEASRQTALASVFVTNAASVPASSTPPPRSTRTRLLEARSMMTGC